MFYETGVKVSESCASALGAHLDGLWREEVDLILVRVIAALLTIGQLSFAPLVLEAKGDVGSSWLKADADEHTGEDALLQALTTAQRRNRLELNVVRFDICCLMCSHTSGGIITSALTPSLPTLSEPERRRRRMRSMARKGGRVHWWAVAAKAREAVVTHRP
jgi:hypothetical protein